ncbi:hypothetical protein BLOT_002767 [Blomia tropicalis]|nr:hypothetical protein BLOT_002767 [Blomia tropicalis]
MIGLLFSLIDDVVCFADADDDDDVLDRLVPAFFGADLVTTSGTTNPNFSSSSCCRRSATCAAIIRLRWRPKRSDKLKIEQNFFAKCYYALRFEQLHFAIVHNDASSTNWSYWTTMNKQTNAKRFDTMSNVGHRSIVECIEPYESYGSITRSFISNMLAILKGKKTTRDTKVR